MATPPSYHTSLLTATDSRAHVHLIIGSNSLAGKRCEQSLATGAKPILVAPDQQEQSSAFHYGLKNAIESGQITWLRQAFTPDLLFSLGREEVSGVVDAVFVTSTSNPGLFNASSSAAVSTAAAAAEEEGGQQTNHQTTTQPRSTSSAKDLSSLCKRNRIPINVVDSVALSSFSILSTHTDGPLQIGVTTNGRGCHLASRIRREVAAALPVGLGAGCARLGEVRRRVQEEDQLLHESLAENAAEQSSRGAGGDEEGLDQSASFNQLITEADLDAAKSRRMRWLSQVCEYWPLKRLAGLSDEDVDIVLQSYPGTASASVLASLGRGNDSTTIPTTDNTSTSGKRGRIILAGSGPGHPDLLTRATYKAIQSADLILADKLVPAGVLDLIPRRTPVSIARKFPGNADQAQEELLSQALAGVQAGRTVLRLKQGDPFIYGRGGEEVEYFRARGYLGKDDVIVLPGITSALSAPLFAGVPPTQRDVADQVLICTGTGKKGKAPVPPEYVASRTCVFLMALHRIGGLVGELTRYLPSELGEDESTTPTPSPSSQSEESRPLPNQQKQPTRPLWPLDTPCAVIERASCPDQRVVRTTLQYVAEAIEQEGSRPPGLLVVGRACEALYKSQQDRAWTVEEGFRGLEVEDAAVNAALGGLAALA
ncbi:tetrapyrrole methylase [Coniella lustricola]|uniref:precorrin-2 dehydrogenase n=1 Tax=Coniella lustricola TaxID=2025994 RepID=A0A2T3AE95_9PEZI|nr:tetrapyrrole methylase [Coniella lustricola]